MILKGLEDSVDSLGLEDVAEVINDTRMQVRAT